MKAIFSYTLLRLAFFFVPFLIMAWAQVPIWIAAVIALVFAFCASYLFLSRQRKEFSDALGRARRGERSASEDEELEDTVVDTTAARANPTTEAESGLAAGADETVGNESTEESSEPRA